MRRRLRNSLVAAATVVLVGSGGSAALGSSSGAQAGLTADVNKILDNPGLRGGQVSLVVRDSAGRQLYARNADNRLLPASNA
ncbi:MAG TPA: hypothetical protein VHC49_11685, partial [Mycobacteriales bacterium]|nr:hypothetical protein [Mycobacteriales bacterium]